jgi:hypothetical protein
MAIGPCSETIKSTADRTASESVTFEFNKEPAQLVGDRDARVGVPIGDDHARPGRSQRSRDLPPDPLPSPGHERKATIQGTVRIGTLGRLHHRSIIAEAAARACADDANVAFRYNG